MNRQWRPRCEDFLRLDVRKLQFPPNAPAWQYPAETLAVSLREDTLRCVHDGLDYLITVDRTACNYGGTRPWFLCPSCGDRRAVLYRPSDCGPLGCRRCLRLLYESEREDALGRAILKVRKIENRICEPATGIVGTAHLAEKLKGKHWNTFDRGAAELWRARAILLQGA